MSSAFLTAGGTVYGPSVTRERAAAVEAVMLAVGPVAWLASHATPAECCVVLGQLAHVRTVVEGCNGCIVSPDEAHGVVIVTRDELALWLDVLERHDDAAKVRRGPPNASPLPASRLLVVAIEGLVAVDWSERGESN